MEVVCAAEDDVTGVMFYPWDFGYSYLCYASIFGTMGLYPTDMAYNSEKESWYFALTEYEDAYRQATESMAEGYSKGWINADFMAWGDKYDTIILNGDWLFNFSYCDETKLKQTDAEVVAMPAPAADGVTPYASAAYVSDVTGWNCMISSDTEYPEICAQIIELITSEDFANHMYWGFEGETYTVDSDGNRSYTQEYLDLDSDAQASVWGIGRNPPYFVDPYVSSFYIGDAKVINASDVGRENMRDVDAKLNSGEYVTYVSQYTPNFDDYTQEDVSNALGTIKTYVTESLTNFVLGNTPMTEWDSFMDGLSAYGDVDTIVEAYNAAEQRPARATQSERTYLIP